MFCICMICMSSQDWRGESEPQTTGGQNQGFRLIFPTNPLQMDIFFRWVLGIGGKTHWAHGALQHGQCHGGWFGGSRLGSNTEKNPWIDRNYNCCYYIYKYYKWNITNHNQQNIILLWTIKDWPCFFCFCRSMFFMLIANKTGLVLSVGCWVHSWLQVTSYKWKNEPDHAGHVSHHTMPCMVVVWYPHCEPMMLVTVLIHAHVQHRRFPPSEKTNSYPQSGTCIYKIV